MSTKPYIVVKIGGRPAGNSPWIRTLLGDLKILMEDHHLVLVHGGGAEVSELSKKLGLEPTFIDGIRMTTAEEMAVVDQVLAGIMNTRILRQARLVDLAAVGLSGVDAGLFTAQPIDQGTTTNRTGRVTKVNTQIIHDLCEKDYLPVLSSVADDGQGEGLNINADEAALVLAQALDTKCLAYISDIPGVLKNGEVLPHLTPSLIEKEISASVIHGGMIPKVRSCATALEYGVETVSIGQVQKSGDVILLVQGKLGTAITKESP